MIIGRTAAQIARRPTFGLRLHLHLHLHLHCLSLCVAFVSHLRCFCIAFAFALSFPLRCLCVAFTLQIHTTRSGFVWDQCNVFQATQGALPGNGISFLFRRCKLCIGLCCGIQTLRALC